MSVRRAMAILVAVSVFASGCVSPMGAASVPETRFDYNQAILHSNNEQLLLNLVRLRYRDPVGFLEVSTVATQYVYSGSAEVSANVDDGLSLLNGRAMGRGMFEERPTITYAPLNGPQYARQLLTPISAETLFLLGEAGWSVERLMTCCLDRIGDVTNARSALGPTPPRIPDNSAFTQMALVFNRLQAADGVSFEILENGEGAAAYLILPKPDHIPAALETDIAYLRQVLGLDADLHKFQIVSAALSDGAGVVVRGRSMLGILYALSHAVEPPQIHTDRGWVTQSTPSPDGVEEWRDFLGGSFKVYSAEEHPADAFVAVRYRDHWFYISDDDLSAKSTFSLLGHLSALQSEAADGGARPLLSLGG